MQTNTKSSALKIIDEDNHTSEFIAIPEQVSQTSAENNITKSHSSGTNLHSDPVSISLIVLDTHNITCEKDNFNNNKKITVCHIQVDTDNAHWHIDNGSSQKISSQRGRARVKRVLADSRSERRAFSSSAYRKSTIVSSEATNKQLT